jgi:wobble nucleotide-excising tRNase
VLEKIIRVDGVGIFHNGTPAARDLAKLTLIYADNARGKSTLSAILRAGAAGDAAALTARPTIGGTLPAAVHLRFRDGTASRSIKFENGSWDSKAPHLHVFDNAFVENNVYAASGATAKVQEHFRKHYWRGIDRWVDEGQRNSVHNKLEECPYCGQSTTARTSSKRTSRTSTRRTTSTCVKSAA